MKMIVDFEVLWAERGLTMYVLTPWRGAMWPKGEPSWIEPLKQSGQGILFLIFSMVKGTQENHYPLNGSPIAHRLLGPSGESCINPASEYEKLPRINLSTAIKSEHECEKTRRSLSGTQK
jgi:hypothetical protein